MKHTVKTVEKLIQSIRDMMQRIDSKDKTIRAQEISFFFYKTVHELAKCTPVILRDTVALDAVIGLAPELEKYRGKGTQRLMDGYVRLFQGIVLEPGMNIFTEGENYSEKEIETAFKKITIFVLSQLNGKRARTRRAASIREEYWRTLLDIGERFAMPEVLDLAQRVAVDTKTPEPERRGALAYLFATWDADESDQVRMSVIEKIRDNPPSRGMLFMILDAEVQCGSLSELGALVELEDWDEASD